MNDKLPALRFDTKPIKGHIKLELFDAKTKELVRKVEKENMVTNAVKNALQAYAATNQMGNLMPLATVGLGGIMLFDGELTADADNVCFPMNAHLVGYGLQDVNTSNTLRGSKNAIESSVKIGEDGFSRMVWDFGTSQANGTIKSLALTRNANPFRPLSGSVVASPSYYGGSNRYNYRSGEAVLAYENGYAYVVHSITSSCTYEESGTYPNRIYTYTRTYTMTICKTYCPMKDYKVGDYATNNPSTPNEVHQTLSWTQITQNTVPDLSDTSAPCVDFDNDGSAYIVWSPGNASGNGTLYVTKIERNGLEWKANNTEILTLTGAQLYNSYHVVVDGHFMVPSYGRHSIYKIDINNPADIKQITLPEKHYFYSTYLWRTATKGGGLYFMALIDLSSGQQQVYRYLNGILYPDDTIVLDGYTTGNTYETEQHISLPLADGYGLGFGSSEYLYGYYFSNYLGTIANLATPVIKNASQTLKITYTLTDA